MSKIRPRQIFPLAALRFGGSGSGDRADCGSDVSVDDLSANPFTALALVYPTSLVNLLSIFTKTTNTGVGWEINMSGTTGNYRITIKHATTNLTYVTSDTPLAKTSRWYWVAVVTDLSLGAGLRAKLYTGSLGGTLTQNALTLTEPSGARSSDAAGVCEIGNSQNGNNISAFPGSIALAALWPRALSFAELVRLTKGGGSGWRESNPVGLWRPGLNSNGGTVVHDESGNPNHGTITGAVPSGVRVSL